MAITVDYSTAPPWLITIPKADLILESGTKYKLTVDDFWVLLRDFTDNETTMAKPKLYFRIPATTSTPSITEIIDEYYSLQFEDGAYSVNIVNGNTNIREVEVKNSVSVNTNNTTGFIDPTFLELGLFNNRVSIDAQNITGNAVVGTGKTPAGGIIGTRSTPCLLASDAKLIASARGLSTFDLMSDLNLTAGDYSGGYTWTGSNRNTELSVGPSVIMTGNAIEEIIVSGGLDGFNRLHRCELRLVTSISGHLFQCDLTSDLSLVGDIEIDQCFSAVPGSGYPVVSGAGTNSVIIRDMRGSIGIDGLTGNTDNSIGVYGGRIVVGAACTGGTLYLRGDPYDITDLSGGLVTIVDQTSSQKVTEILAQTKLAVALSA